MTSTASKIQVENFDVRVSQYMESLPKQFDYKKLNGSTFEVEKVYEATDKEGKVKLSKSGNPIFLCDVKSNGNIYKSLSLTSLFKNLSKDGNEVLVSSKVIEENSFRVDEVVESVSNSITYQSCKTSIL